MKGLAIGVLAAAVFAAGTLALYRLVAIDAAEGYFPDDVVHVSQQEEPHRVGVQ